MTDQPKEHPPRVWINGPEHSFKGHLSAWTEKQTGNIGRETEYLSTQEMEQLRAGDAARVKELEGHKAALQDSYSKSQDARATLSELLTQSKEENEKLRTAISNYVTFKKDYAEGKWQKGCISAVVERERLQNCMSEALNQTGTEGKE